MKKRVLSILLCAVMLLGLLAGCGKPSEPGTEDPGNSTPTETEKIVVYTMCQGVATDYANVVAEINKITTKEIGVEVELILLDMGQYFQQYFMLLSGSESFDLIASYYDLAIAANHMGAFLPLDDLIAEYGPDITAQFLAEDLEACKINGSLYGIPTKHSNSLEVGFLYNKDITDELGIDVSNVKDFADWEAVMAQVKAAYPGIMCMTSSMGGTVGSILENSTSWDALVDNLGVIMYDDPEHVVNLYETELYKELCLTMRDWNSKGYIQADAATTSELFSDLAKVGQAFSCYTSPYVGDTILQSKQIGVNLGFVPIGSPKKSTTAMIVNQWNIPATSKNPEAAVKFINLLETNAELANLMAYGVEGVNYQVLEDGTFDFLEGQNAGNAAYYPNYSQILPNYFLTGTWNGAVDNMQELVEERDSRAVASPAYGFLFDSAKVTNEITACTNVVKQYAGALESGAVDVETVLPQFIQALKEAGIDAIVAEKDAQYQAFLNSK